MDNKIYKIIEIVGSSSISVEDAIQSAIACASNALDNLGWFKVKEVRGNIADGKVDHYQVILKVGFTLK